MASPIGAIFVRLGIDSAQFSAGLKDVQGSLARVGRQMQRIGAVMSVGVGAALGGLTLAVRGVLNDADEMAKAAQKFGVPIEELSRLKHAADLSGVSLDGLGTGLRKLSQNMNDAANGTGEALDAFEQLGISVTDATGALKAPTAVLNEIANAFADMPDGALKTALAMDILGRSGTELIPLLNAGAAGLQSMKDEADALGIVFTAETGAAAERFNDNLTRLNRAFDGIKTVIAAELAPVLADLSDWFAENGPMIVQKIRDVVGWFRNLSPETQRLAAIIAGLTAVLGPLLVVLGTLAVIVSAISVPVLLVVAALAALGVALTYFREEVATVVGSVVEAWNGFWARVREIVNDFIDWMTLIPANVRAMAHNIETTLVELAGKIVGFFADLPARMLQIGKDIMGGLADGIESGARDLVRPVLDRAVKDMVDDTTGPLGIQSPSKVFRDIGEQTMAGLANGLQSGGAGASEAISGTVDRMLAEIGRLQVELPARTQLTIDSLGTSFSGILDPLKQALTSGELNFRSFADALVGIGRRLADRLIEEAFRPIEDAIAGLFSGAGRSGGGGFFGKALGFIGSAIGGAFGGFGGGAASAGSKIGGFATGGIAEGLAIVGERGRELVNFGSPSRVFSNAETERMLGGGGAPMVHFSVDEGVKVTWLNDAARRAAALDRQSQADTLRQVPDIAAAGFRQRPGLRGPG